MTTPSSRVFRSEVTAAGLLRALRYCPLPDGLPVPSSLSLCASCFLRSDWYWMLGQSLYVVGSWCRNLLLAVGVLSGRELSVEVKALVLSKATWRILAKCVGSTPPIVLTQLFPVFCAWTREWMADP